MSGRCGGSRGSVVTDESPRRRTHNDLACLGRPLHLSDLCHRGPGEEEFRVGSGGAEQVDITAVDTLGHAKRYPPDRRGDLGCGLQRGSHLNGRCHCLVGVVRSLEQQQQRISAVLEERPATVGCKSQHVSEHTVENLGELLGTHTPERRQPLRKRGEP